MAGPRAVQASLRELASQLRGLPCLSSLLGPPSLTAAFQPGGARLTSLRFAHSAASHGKSQQQEWQHTSQRNLSGAAQLAYDEAEEAEEESAEIPLAMHGGSMGGDAGGGDMMPYPSAASFALGDAALLQPSDEQALATEGEVYYDARQSLEAAIVRHWRAMSPEYRARVAFDDFGDRYLRQVEAEEAARRRALQRLREAEGGASAAAAAAGVNIAGAGPLGEGRADAVQSRMGSMTRRLVHSWLPLLEEAIRQEQQEIMSAPARDSKKDRPNYGPYLLLLDPTDLALLTIQSALSHTAAGIRRSEEPGREAAAAPAVLVADAIGRAVADFVATLRYKSAERNASARRQRRKQQHQQQHHHHHQGGLGVSGGASTSEAAAAGGGGEALVLGPRTRAALEQRVAGLDDAAGKYAAGLAAVAAYADRPGLRARSRANAQAVLAGSKWEVEARLKVGAALLALLVENSPVPDARARGGLATLPAFEYKYERVGLKQQAFLRASGALCSLVGTDESLRASMLAKHPPMLVPPVPWTSHRDGGYLTMRNWCMRTRWSMLIKDKLEGVWRADMGGGASSSGRQPQDRSQQQQPQQHQLEGEVSPGQLQRRQRPRGFQQALDALNVLGGTPWCINGRVFGVMEECWAAKQAVAGLPSQELLRTPPPPGTGFRLTAGPRGGSLVAMSGPLTAAEARDHRLACDDVRKRRRNAASLRADFQLKFNVARDYRGEPEFYYPHTVDFRGRAYPMHPNLQHLGDDVCRGLLQFAQGRPLGRHGLDWLYVHLANMWGHGVDKLSFDLRRQFARDQLTEVLMCADTPHKVTWWREAEKPWQFLAACFEVAGALASFNPEAYESRLPVHMDGSCNGLQHYAALGRDEAGGRAVNLLPSEQPQDVYKGVAAIVARRVERDSKPRPALDSAGQPVLDAVSRKPVVLPARPEAARVVGMVDRKLVKQTVMTSVYGVTPIGAREQIEARLRDRGWNDADRDALWAASKYLADATIDAIGEMFTNAKEIMNWLAECASLVAGQGSAMTWTNPCGLPILQPYHTIRSVGVSTLTQTFNVVVEGADRDAPVTKARQRSAFPPNFIHSIDSAHMMRTAVACAGAGVTFAGVHDSFWTHAGSVGAMNRLLRDEFVVLHSEEDLLGGLARQLAADFPGVEFPPVPGRGRLQVARVRTSRYFFS